MISLEPNHTPLGAGERVVDAECSNRAAAGAFASNARSSHFGLAPVTP